MPSNRVLPRIGNDTAIGAAGCSFAGTMLRVVPRGKVFLKCDGELSDEGESAMDLELHDGCKSASR